MLVIAEKFGFAWPMQDCIKTADEMALRNEWECFMLQGGTMEVWDQPMAKAKFLEMYYKLIS